MPERLLIRSFGTNALAPTSVRGVARGAERRKPVTAFRAKETHRPAAELRNNLPAHRMSMWACKCANSRRCTMCDYSLQNVKSRPAAVGDKLVTHNFGTGTRGF